MAVLPYLGPGVRNLDTEAKALVVGEFVGDWTGNATVAADLDGDGTADLVVGARGHRVAPAGQAFVFLGPVAGVLTRGTADYVVVGEHPGDHLGSAVAVGDFDGDGEPDLALGAPYADSPDVPYIDLPYTPDAGAV